MNKMVENEKQALVPRLRFPEFRDAGRWKEKKLDDVGRVRMCKRILKEQTTSHGDIPFYKIGTFGGIPDAYISQELFERYRNNFPFPKNGAVLISASGTIGRTVRYKGELAYFQDSNIVWLDNNENLITDNFLFYLYQLIDWSPSVGAIQRLYNENILAAKVKFPSIPEQQRIADCLASLDALIAAQSEKLDALKTHKKGLMQQLFPSEGETLPRLRFPEFRDAGEWGSIKLIDVTDHWCPTVEKIKPCKYLL
jgi:type I restriction enzyme S subunit